jgi:hypothetical protein
MFAETVPLVVLRNKGVEVGWGTGGQNGAATSWGNQNGGAGSVGQFSWWGYGRRKRMPMEVEVKDSRYPYPYPRMSTPLQSCGTQSRVMWVEKASKGLGQEERAAHGKVRQRPRQRNVFVGACWAIPPSEKA